MKHRNHSLTQSANPTFYKKVDKIHFKTKLISIFYNKLIKAYFSQLKNHTNLDESNNFNLIDDLLIILYSVENKNILMERNIDNVKKLFKNLKNKHFPNKKTTSLIERNYFLTHLTAENFKKLIKMVNDYNFSELPGLDIVLKISKFKNKTENCSRVVESDENDRLIIEKKKRGKSLKQFTKKKKKIEILKTTQKKTKKIVNLKRLSYLEFNILNKENKKICIMNEDIIKNQDKPITQFLIFNENKTLLCESDMNIGIKTDFNAKTREINDYKKNCKEFIDISFAQYGIKRNESLKILDGTNGNTNKALEFIEKKDFKLIWSDDEDDVLIRTKNLDSFEIKLLIKYKGIDEIKARCMFKNFECIHLFV